MRLEEEMRRRAMEEEMKKLQMEDQARQMEDQARQMEQQLRLKEQQLRQEEDQLRRQRDQQQAMQTQLLQTQQAQQHVPVQQPFNPNIMTNMPTSAGLSPMSTSLPIATNVPFSPVPPHNPVPGPVPGGMPAGPLPVATNMPVCSILSPACSDLLKLPMASPMPGAYGMTNNPQFSTVYPPNTYQQTNYYNQGSMFLRNSEHQLILSAYPPNMYQQTTVTTTYQQQQQAQQPVYIYGKLKKKAFMKAHGY